MSWVAAAVVGGALITSEAAGDAADAQAGAADAATGEQRRQFNLIREDQAPYREAGVEALTRLRNYSDHIPRPDEVMAEPGYQFGLQEGIGNIQNTAAARGGLYSGNTLRALTRYGTDYATTRYNDAFNRMQATDNTRWNRLASLAGIGQTATNQVGAAGQNLANQVGQIAMSNANAQGAAGMARGNIWGNALGQLGSMAGRNNWFGGSSGSSGSTWQPSADWWAGGDGYAGE